MRFYALVVIAEAVIIAGSGIDARWRPAPDRRPWFARWFWWHLAPLWLLWLALISALMSAAVNWARSSYQRYEINRSAAPLLIANDEVGERASSAGRIVLRRPLPSTSG